MNLLQVVLLFVIGLPLLATGITVIMAFVRMASGEGEHEDPLSS